uniref:Uncharacterized protein n=1 Tax=Physcomitrium patens TaxID=3218 RepID=A0A2K1J8N2_PHYPA|nr:hypothetical protein PHYPA_020976 [Physcomitrium patens]
MLLIVVHKIQKARLIILPILGVESRLLITCTTFSKTAGNGGESTLYLLGRKFLPVQTRRLHQSLLSSSCGVSMLATTPLEMRADRPPPQAGCAPAKHWSPERHGSGYLSTGFVQPCPFHLRLTRNIASNVLAWQMILDDWASFVQWELQSNLGTKHLAFMLQS